MHRLPSLSSVIFLSLIFLSFSFDLCAFAPLRDDFLRLLPWIPGSLVDDSKAARGLGVSRSDVAEAGCESGEGRAAIEIAACSRVPGAQRRPAAHDPVWRTGPVADHRWVRSARAVALAGGGEDAGHKLAERIADAHSLKIRQTHRAVLAPVAAPRIGPVQHGGEGGRPVIVSGQLTVVS